MYTFQIKDLIRILTSTTCFETHGSIIRRTVVNAVFYGVRTHTSTCYTAYLNARKKYHKNCMYKLSSC